MCVRVRVCVCERVSAHVCVCVLVRASVLILAHNDMQSVTSENCQRRKKKRFQQLFRVPVLKRHLKWESLDNHSNMYE